MKISKVLGVKELEVEHLQSGKINKIRKTDGKFSQSGRYNIARKCNSPRSDSRLIIVKDFTSSVLRKVFSGGVKLWQSESRPSKHIARYMTELLGKGLLKYNRLRRNV